MFIYILVFHILQSFYSWQQSLQEGILMLFCISHNEWVGAACFDGGGHAKIVSRAMFLFSFFLSKSFFLNLYVLRNRPIC